jgi:protein SCO1/2
MKPGIGIGAVLLALSLLVGAVPAVATEADDVSAFDPKQAIAYSQAAVSRQVADYELVNRKNKNVSLAQFRGRPLVINLIYTACSDFCPTLVQTLYGAVETAQEVFGTDSFAVISIGFDPRGDTPARMRAFARSQGVDLPNWYFLSGSEDQIKSLAKNLGFIYYPSPRGFDHLAQVSILDADGRVSQQIYGTDFDSPALVEPLRALFTSQPVDLGNPAELVERIRLFCTYYDPTRQTYSFDYSIIISLVIGALSLLGLTAILVRAIVQQHHDRRNTADLQKLSDS